MLDELIRSLDRQEGGRISENETFLARQRILGELAPRLWDRLRQEVKSQCHKYPRHLSFEVRPSTEIVVRSVNRGLALEAQYLPEAKRVVFEVGENAGEYRITLDSQENAAFVDTNRIPYPSVEFVAEDLLAKLLIP